MVWKAILFSVGFLSAAAPSFAQSGHDGRWSGRAVGPAGYVYFDVKDGKIIGGMVNDACCMTGTISSSGAVTGIILIGDRPRRAVDITGNLADKLFVKFTDESGMGRPWINIVTVRK